MRAHAQRIGTRTTHTRYSMNLQERQNQTWSKTERSDLYEYSNFWGLSLARHHQQPPWDWSGLIQSQVKMKMEKKIYKKRKKNKMLCVNNVLSLPKIVDYTRIIRRKTRKMFHRCRSVQILIAHDEIIYLELLYEFSLVVRIRRNGKAGCRPPSPLNR